MFDEEMVSPSKRKKQADEISNADSSTTEPTATSEDSESEASTAGTEVTEDDGLPHPRVCFAPFHISQEYDANSPQPFESRREFFVRTSNEWQEILMTSLRWKNIQPESLAVKVCIKIYSPSTSYLQRLFPFLNGDIPCLIITLHHSFREKKVFRLNITC